MLSSKNRRLAPTVVFVLLINATFGALANEPNAVQVTKNHSIKFVDPGIVGIRFVTFERYPPQIFEVYPDTPAAKSGLRAGDAILAVNGTSTKAMSDTNLQKLILGKPGTRLTLKISRNKITLSRTLVRMHAIEFAKRHPELGSKYFDTW